MADDIGIQTGVDIKSAFRGACIHPEGTIGAEPNNSCSCKCQRVIDEGELKKAGFATMGTGAFAEAAPNNRPRALENCQIAHLAL